MGRLGCGTPPELLSYMLDLFEAATADEPVDLILLTGDLSGHGVPQGSYDNFDWDKYEILKTVLAKVMETLSLRFPEIPILLTLGNNDVPVHYQAVKGDLKADFQPFLHETFFVKHPANAKFADEIKKDFLDGAYYRYDISEKVTALILNTLPYNWD